MRIKHRITGLLLAAAVAVIAPGAAQAGGYIFSYGGGYADGYPQHYGGWRGGYADSYRYYQHRHWRPPHAAYGYSRGYAPRYGYRCPPGYYGYGPGDRPGYYGSRGSLHSYRGYSSSGGLRVIIPY